LGSAIIGSWPIIAGAFLALGKRYEELKWVLLKGIFCSSVSSLVIPKPKKFLSHPKSESDTISNLAIKFNITKAVIVSANSWFAIFQRQSAPNKYDPWSFNSIRKLSIWNDLFDRIEIINLMLLSMLGKIEKLLVKPSNVLQIDQLNIHME